MAKTPIVSDKEYVRQMDRDEDARARQKAARRKNVDEKDVDRFLKALTRPYEKE